MYHNPNYTAAAPTGPQRSSVAASYPAGDCGCRLTQKKNPPPSSQRRTWVFEQTIVALLPATQSERLERQMMPLPATTFQGPAGWHAKMGPSRRIAIAAPSSSCNGQPVLMGRQRRVSCQECFHPAALMQATFGRSGTLLQECQPSPFYGWSLRLAGKLEAMPAVAAAPPPLRRPAGHARRTQEREAQLSLE